MKVGSWKVRDQEPKEIKATRTAAKPVFLRSVSNYLSTEEFGVVRNRRRPGIPD